jgi:parallel beta-helix repeat protein
LLITFKPLPIKAAKEIWVPSQYPTIQEAIDAAEDDYIINVVAKAQPYYEHIVIDKKVTLVGHLTPVIDGGGLGEGFIVDIKNNDVLFSGFRLQNGQGIKIWDISNCTIKNNIIRDVGTGIHLNGSSNIKIINNRLYRAYDMLVDKAIRLFNSSNNLIEGNRVYALYGISIRDSLSFNNTVISNDLSGTPYGIELYYCFNNIISNNTLNDSFRAITFKDTSGNIVSYHSFINTDVRLFGTSDNNVFFHNNFINSSISNSTMSNIWDVGWPTGGNYWDAYECNDIKSGQLQDISKSDGICDIAFEIDSNNVDRYPLKGLSHIFIVNFKSTDYLINVISNSSILDFQLNVEENELRFQVSGPTGTGFCRVGIPSDLMSGPFDVYVNEVEVPYTTPYSESTIYFTYNHPIQEERDYWPTFHHDITNSGNTQSDAPESNSTLWTFNAYNRTSGRYITSSPAVVAGKIYFGTYEAVFCLNASTGEHIWNYSNARTNAMHSPTIVGDRLFVSSFDYSIYCLNATTGEFIWKHSTSSTMSTCPTVSEGRVYIGSGDDWFYCLNASSGELIWRYKTGYDIAWSSAAVASGMVYVGSEDHNLYCLDAETGTSIWNFTALSWPVGYIHSSPAIFEDKVFFGSDDNKVYCLNAFTGAHIWNFSTNDAILSSPAIAYNRVYIGSGDSDRRLYCLNASTGKELWSYKTSGPVYSSPAVANNKVFFGSLDSNIYCLDAITGTLIWNYETGDSTQSSPAIANGRVYIGSDDGILYAFGTADIPEQPEIFVDPLILDFGNIPVDYPPSMNQTTITNVGDEPLAIESITLTLDGDGCFRIMGIYREGLQGALLSVEPPFVLSPGKTVYIHIKFNDIHDMADRFTGILEIESDDPNNMTVEVSLLGSGATASGASTLIHERQWASDETGFFEIPFDVTGNVTEITEFSSYNILHYSADLTDDNSGVLLNGLLKHPDSSGQIILEVKSTSSPEILTIYEIIIAPFGSALASSISCFVSSPEIELDNQVTVSGVINPEAAEVTVALTYTKPDMTTLTRTVITDLEGNYIDTFIPSLIGAWSVQARWEGNDTYEGSSSALTYFSVTKISTTLSCSASQTDIEIEAAITVSGSIRPATSDATVTLTYTKPDSTSLERAVTTDSKGDYSDTYTPSTTGSWEVEASWEGDSTHLSATSITETFEVREKEGISWILYGGAAAIIVLIAIVLFFVLYKKKIKI